MSQYPPPYSPPPQQQSQLGYGMDFNYYQTQPDLLAPARRASVMMFILGGLLAIGGLCCGGIATMVPMDEVLAQQPALQSMPGVTAEVMKLSMIVMSVLGFVFGTVLLILGYFVRGGGTVPVVISLVLVVLAGLLNLANLAFGLAGAARAPGPEMVGAMCVNVVPLVLLAVLIASLVQAMRAAPRIAMMKSQYQQQYWQYQQQQQMYQAGYLAPPPPTPPSQQQFSPSPPPPVPPATPDDNSRGDTNAPST